MTAATAPSGPTLREVLDLDRLDENRFRSCLRYSDPGALYGGQLAAQALVAAGDTVADDRAPHSLHLYYLRSGTAGRPLEFCIDRDRDGRAFSARRVVALQDGKVLATASCSFAVPAGGPDVQMAPAPEVPVDPADLPYYPAPRLFGFECRLAPGQHAAAEWPTRFWARSAGAPTGDRLREAATLAYLSDRSSGIGGLDVGTPMVPISLDHAIWFHRPVLATDWMMLDLVPHTLAAERTWYTGTIHDRAGVLAASLTQEVLTRPRQPPPGRPA
jgi:acyl-CoA thioesterase-2